MPEDDVPPPSKKDEDDADQSVKDWLKKQGYPSPDPKDQ